MHSHRLNPRTPMETERAITSRDGVSIRYRLWQPGKPRRLLVLIHGLSSNMSRWSEFMEFTRLKDDWDILRLDLRGHEGSPYRGRLGMELWCQDICEIIDTEHYRNAVLVGHSLGAQVAMHFATRYPSRTAGLILIDPTFHQALNRKMRWLYRLRWLLSLTIGAIRLLNALGIYRRHIPPRDLRALDEQTRKTLLEVGRMEEMVSRYGSPWPDLRHFPTANYLQEILETIKPVPPASGIAAPVLVLLAAAPTYTDPVVTRRMTTDFPRAQVVDIHAYHWPLTEKPEETRDAIETWCRQFTSLPPAGPAS